MRSSDAYLVCCKHRRALIAMQISLKSLYSPSAGGTGAMVMARSTEEGRQRTKNHLTVALPFLIYVVIISLKGVYDLNQSDFMQIAPIL